MKTNRVFRWLMASAIAASLPLRRARFEKAKIFTIAQKDLKVGLKKASYAISVDETRYVLNGILIIS